MQELENWSIDRFIEYARNPRKNDHAVDRIASAINEFGFKVPIIAKSDGSVVDGHLRLKAARKLKLDTLPVLLADDLTDAQIKAFRLSINKMAEIAEWDDELLALELEELQDLDFDMGLIGFDQDELDALLNNEVQGLVDDDEIPEVTDAIVKPGDKWILGDHILKCGDSTNQDDVDDLMGGIKADMVWTDPPYNVEYVGKTKAAMTIQNDAMDDSAFKQFLVDCFTVAFNSTKAGRPMYVAHADSEGENFRSSFKQSGFMLKQCIIWVKSHMVMGRQDYQWQHEPVLYGWKPGEAHKWYGAFDKKTVIDDDVDVKKLDKKQLIQMINAFRNNKNTTVIREQKPTVSDLHPTTKPVALIQRMVQNSSREEDVVLDLFGGSGSTMIACEKIHRHARLMEIDPVYATVIIQRWCDFTGKDATLESSGEKFNSLKQ